MLSPVVYNALGALSATPSLVQERATQLMQQWAAQPDAPDELMEMLLQSERLAKIYSAGKQNDAELIAALDNAAPKHWKDMPDLPCDISKQKKLAAVMLQSVGLETPPTQPPTIVRLNPSLLARYPAEAVIQHCTNNGISVDAEMEDIHFDTLLVNACDGQGIEGLATLFKSRLAVWTHMLKFGMEMPEEVSTQRDANKFDAYRSDIEKEYFRRVGKDELRWNLTYLPTQAEAEMDGFDDYPEYLDFFFDAVDQPWGAIQKAQSHLIAPFNNARELHITNSDGTDVTMSINGHTFANSVIAQNTPGSEIFSGPVKDSINGTIVAKGNFAIELLGKARRIRDITLHFEHGRIVEAHAVEGDADLQEILSLEDGLDPEDPKFEGSRHVGEIGIGTNPHIRNHSVNGLLVEKIGGSFHVALGSCYGDSYLGEEVLMSNGNKSKIHWDLTTMLRGKEGRMYLDGHLIQKDGDWIDCPELGLNQKDVDVLNRGWRAIPEASRPEYWRKKIAAEEARLTR